MCEKLPGERCASDTCATSIQNAAAYVSAHPDGPAVDPVAKTSAVTKRPSPSKWTADTVEEATAQLSGRAAERPRVDAKGSAAAMRHDLRALYGIPFSVRMASGTAYGWVDVTWADGPRWSEVNERTFAYQATDFNGMTDGYDPVNEDAPVRYSLRGVNHTRMIGEKGRATIAAIFAKCGIEDVDAPMPEGTKDMRRSFSYSRKLTEDEQARLIGELNIPGMPAHLHAISDAQSAAAYIHQHLDFRTDPPELHNHR